MQLPVNKCCQLSPCGWFVRPILAILLTGPGLQALLPDPHIRWLTLNHGNICIVLTPSQTCKNRHQCYIGIQLHIQNAENTFVSQHDATSVLHNVQSLPAVQYQQLYNTAQLC